MGLPLLQSNLPTHIRYVLSIDKIRTILMGNVYIWCHIRCLGQHLKKAVAHCLHWCFWTLWCQMTFTNRDLTRSIFQPSWQSIWNLIVLHVKMIFPNRLPTRLDFKCFKIIIYKSEIWSAESCHLVVATIFRWWTLKGFFIKKKSKNEQNRFF